MFEQIWEWKFEFTANSTNKKSFFSQMSMCKIIQPQKSVFCGASFTLYKQSSLLMFHGPHATTAFFFTEISIQAEPAG